MAPVSTNRIVTVVLGLVALILTSICCWGAYDHWWQFFYSMVTIFFICSLIWFLLFQFDVLSTSDILTKIDIIYHLIGGVLLLIPAVILLILTIVNCGKHCLAVYQIMGIIAEIIVVVNGLIYLLIAKVTAGK